MLKMGVKDVDTTNVRSAIQDFFHNILHQYANVQTAIMKLVITHETNRDFKARFVCFQNVAYTYILYI